jgi:chemotaxis family two-component system sensor kinase Cph1
LEAFSYSVSHDLRSPLRHIGGYVELLNDKASSLGEEGSRYLAKIADATKQMGLLIDSLLAFSRMGRTAIQPTWVATDELVGEVRESLIPDINGRIIEWEIADLPPVYVDKALFRQVWTNLLDNAVKYTRRREKARISVGCMESPGEITFSIRDNGAGFDMRYAEKLFGIFQRLHFSEDFEGTGIGLANVKRIIDRHGGRIWAEGELGKGATFWFTLPHKKLNEHAQP